MPTLRNHANPAQFSFKAFGLAPAGFMRVTPQCPPIQAIPYSMATHLVHVYDASPSHNGVDLGTFQTNPPYTI